MSRFEPCRDEPPPQVAGVDDRSLDKDLLERANAPGRSLQAACPVLSAEVARVEAQPTDMRRYEPVHAATRDIAQMAENAAHAPRQSDSIAEIVVAPPAGAPSLSRRCSRDVRCIDAEAVDVPPQDVVLPGQNAEALAHLAQRLAGRDCGDQLLIGPTSLSGLSFAVWSNMCSRTGGWVSPVGRAGRSGLRGQSSVRTRRTAGRCAPSGPRGARARPRTRHGRGR
jgi:hypothetical protein